MTTILVTGSNRGIGLEFVRQYAADGCRMIACCRTPAKAEALKTVPGDVRIMELDVASRDSARQLAGVLKDEPIDILINNAGVFGPKAQGADDQDYGAILETLHVNSIGPLIVSQALKDNLRRGHDKKIAVLTSLMGAIGENGSGYLAYRASKAALNMIMHVVARDWARDGLLIGIYHPGWVQTDMGGAGASLTPQESVRGLRQRIAELSPERSGRFLDHHGKELAW
ncbi:MAG: SDR family oxidoreductase [Alphaproteobacteria bacterium]|nr:SDR family oxidoreductase [Alphaproteobacteria bacterium]